MLANILSNFLSFPSLLILYLNSTQFIPSWSTTFNILFFQLSWSTLVLSNSPLRIEVISCAAVRVLCFWIPSLVMTGVDWGIGAVSRRRERKVIEGDGIKVGAGREGVLPEGPDVNIQVPDLKVPVPEFLGGSGGGSGSEGRHIGGNAKFTKGLRRIFSGGKQELKAIAVNPRGPPTRTQQAVISLANMIIGLILQGTIEYVLVYALEWKSAVKISSRLPIFSLGGVAFDLLKLGLAREVIQYTLHRFLLHNYTGAVYRSSHGRSGSLAKPLADFHKSYYHSIKVPNPFSAHYDHPLAYIFFRFIPYYLPSMIFRPHLITHLLFLALTSLEEALSHSNYQNPPSIPLVPFLPIHLLPTRNMVKRVDAHISSRARGDDGGFGAWGLMDWLLKTTVRGGENWGEDVRGNVEKGVDVGAVKVGSKARRDSGYADDRRLGAPKSKKGKED